MACSIAFITCVVTGRQQVVNTIGGLMMLRDVLWILKSQHDKSKIKAIEAVENQYSSVMYIDKKIFLR